MKNSVKKYLFTPGPTPVPPEVLLEMALPVIHHRTPEFSAVLDQARERMRPLFGTRQEVILLAASGTGAMEAAVTNLLAPGEHAVYVNGGKFGERWGKLLAAYGMTGHEISVEWGRAARPEQVEEALRANPNARAVLMQASETSTCAVHPVAEVAAITRAARRDADRRRNYLGRRVRAEDGRVGHRRSGHRQSEGADAAAGARDRGAVRARAGSAREARARRATISI